MDRTAEAGKTKGGGVCFFINKKWCDPRNISILSRSCSPHLEHLSIICRPFYLPREFSSIVVTAVYIPPKADSSLALSNYTTNSADISTYILTLHASSLETLTKLTSKRSSLTFISTYPVQPEDWIHSITATPNSKMPTKPTHCRRLENQTTRPSFSLRIINNGFFKNPWWRGKWRAGPPTLKLRYRRLLMTSTGTCSGRVHLTSANSRRVALSFVNTLTEQATETVTIKTFSNQKPWVDRTIRDAVNHRTAAYNAGILSGNMSEYKSSCYALRRAVKSR